MILKDNKERYLIVKKSESYGYLAYLINKDFKIIDDFIAYDKKNIEELSESELKRISKEEEFWNTLSEEDACLEIKAIWGFRNCEEIKDEKIIKELEKCIE